MSEINRNEILQLLDEASIGAELDRLVLTLLPDEEKIVLEYIKRVIMTRPKKSIIQQRVRELGPEAWG